MAKGVEGVKGRFRGGRSLPYFPKKEKRICGVTSKIFNVALPNLNPKIVGDTFFVTAHIFAKRPHLVALTRLRETKTKSIFLKKILLIFSSSES